MDRAEYNLLINDLIERALAAAGGSFDVRIEEPYLVALTFLIRTQAEYVEDGIAALCALIPGLDWDWQGSDGVVALLEYCVHVLRPPSLIASVREKQAAAKLALETGESLRPWQTARNCERVLDALKDPWLEADIYASLDPA